MTHKIIIEKAIVHKTFIDGALKSNPESFKRNN